MMTNHPRPPWRKSSYSNGQANCVEVVIAARTVAVRDSKDPHGPALAFRPAGVHPEHQERHGQPLTGGDRGAP